MKADPFAQLKLLDVQALDSTIDQARHRRANLPELAEIETLTSTRAKLTDQLRDLRITVDDLGLEQRKADADVEQVKARRTRDQDRMDAGLITNPKDLQRMQEELVSLTRRIDDLEEVELEVMARLEDAERDLTTLTAELEETVAKLEEATTRRDEKTAEIDAELTGLEQERATLVADIPEDLVALYERLRGQKGGIGAAELRARQCGGCMLALDAGMLGEIRKAATDDVVRCEECSRILVRTAESGL